MGGSFDILLYETFHSFENVSRLQKRHHSGGAGVYLFLRIDVFSLISLENNLYRE